MCNHFLLRKKREKLFLQLNIELKQIETDREYVNQILNLKILKELCHGIKESTINISFKQLFFCFVLLTELNTVYFGRKSLQCSHEHHDMQSSSRCCINSVVAALGSLFSSFQWCNCGVVCCSQKWCVALHVPQN